MLGANPNQIKTKSKMEETNMECKKEIRMVCQNCKKYNRCTKKCSKDGKYVARKNSCPDFSERK